MLVVWRVRFANINENSDKSINELWQLQIKLKSEYITSWLSLSHYMNKRYCYIINIFPSQVIAAEGEQKVRKYLKFLIFPTVVCRPAEPWGQRQMSSRNLQQPCSWDISRLYSVEKRSHLVPTCPVFTFHYLKFRLISLRTVWRVTSWGF